MPKKASADGDLGKRVLGELERLRYSQAWLAEKCKVSPQHIWKIVRGVTSPGPATLDKIAFVLGVTPEWLAFGVGPRWQEPAQAITESEARLIAAFRHLDPMLQAVIFGLVETLAKRCGDPK